MTAPRPGSSIDRAVRALQAGPLPRAELARLIERDDDELDGLLRYGVRMGMLVRSNGDEDVSYSLGAGVPVDADARPAPGPMLASAAPELAPGGAEGPAAPGRPAARAPMAEAAPVAFPTAARPPAAAAPAARPAPAPDLSVNPAELAGLPPAVLAELRQSPYRPAPGSQAEMLLAYLQRHAPHGGDVWLSPAELARSGARQYSVSGSLGKAIRNGAAVARGTPLRYQAGPNAPTVLGVLPTLAPAAAPAPAASPRPAAPAPGPAPADEHAAALLRHIDAQIEHHRRALGELARRREQVEMVAAMKGRRV